MTRSNNLLYNLLAILTVSMWGVTFVSTKILIGEGMSPTGIFISRFTIAYVCILLLSHKRLLASSVKDELLMLGAGVTGGSLYFLAENSALGITYASNVSLIICTSPIFTMIMGRLIFNDSIKPVAWVGSIIALGGVAAVVLNGSINFGINPLGDMLTVVASVSWAAYCMFLKRLTSGGYDNMFVTRKVFFYGIITALPYIMLTDTPLQFFPLHPSATVIINLLFLGIGASFVCYLVWNVVVKAMGPERASNYIYLNPPVTVIASVILLSEHLSAWTVAGAAAIIGGVYLTSK